MSEFVDRPVGGRHASVSRYDEAIRETMLNGRAVSIEAAPFEATRIRHNIAERYRRGVYGTDGKIRTRIRDGALIVWLEKDRTA